MQEHLRFDLIAWASAIAVGVLMWHWRLRATLVSLRARVGAGYFAALSAGSLLGAYGFGSLNLYLSDIVMPARSMLGALVGAITAVEIYKLRHGIRGSTGVIFAAPLAAAIAVGRIGCYRAGLIDQTHGIATTLPWGHDFGDGIARHPVQLYESASMALVLIAVLIGFARRSPWMLAQGFYLIVGVYGAQRFAWEFLKPYARVLGPFNVFHLLAALLCAYAIYMGRHASHART
ncbi:MAG: prolipoprotein diacylglyceryl transferase [Gammaproteobacteria bacterium]|nr:prolipoprotein diacylglyceryl transferase [Gammaproteobacteria bacterium]